MVIEVTTRHKPNSALDTQLQLHLFSIVKTKPFKYLMGSRLIIQSTKISLYEMILKMIFALLFLLIASLSNCSQLSCKLVRSKVPLSSQCFEEKECRNQCAQMKQKCEKVCGVSYKEKCSVVTENVCKSSWKSVCRSTVNKVCQQVKIPNCTTDYQQKCSVQDEEDCSIIEKEVCEDVNKLQCDTVLEDVCDIVDEEECQPIVNQKCDTEDEEVCEEVEDE